MPIPTEAEIMSARPEQLTLMLYEGAVRFAADARSALDAGEFAEAAGLIERTAAIIRELDDSLNDDAGELSLNLARIYEYLMRRLAVALEVPEALDEVVGHLEGLAEAWREICVPAAVGAGR